MENPQHHPRELADESGIRATPSQESSGLPEMRTPEDLYLHLQKNQIRGVAAGKILDAYNAQQKASEDVTRIVQMPQPPQEETRIEPRPKAPRMTMAEALEHENKGANKGEGIPFLADEDVVAIDDIEDIEDMTSEAEEWTDEDEAEANGLKKAA